nr:tail fiber domain-containing protein [Bacteroidota bacterium]
EWKTPLDQGMLGTQFGFIAQEVEEILPSVVLTEDNDEQTKALKYSEFIPLLVKAVQELKAENEVMKARIASLENK